MIGLAKMVKEPKELKWKHPRKVAVWLRKAGERWGMPVRVFVKGQLMGECSE